MYQWLQAIVSGAALVLPQFLSPTGHTSHPLLSKETLEWTESIRIKYNLPGISIGIIASPDRTGGDWQNETHGLGYMDARGRAVDGDTLFAIASNSKLFAALSIGLLVDNQTVLENGNKLDYNTKIKDILPDWRMMDPYMQDHLDVLDILSMRSGMPRHDDSYGEEDASRIIARLPYLKPSTEIRQTMQYNNIHYFVIGEIVAQITSSSLPEYVKAHILDPIGMTSSFYNHTKAEQTGHRSKTFVRADRNSTRCVEVWSTQNKLDRSCYGQPFETSWFTSGNGLFIAGPGGLVSSANDVVKWLRELLDPKVVPRKVIAETHKTFIPAFSEIIEYDEVGTEGYGQGQVTFNYRGHEVIQHGGDVPGFSTQITRVPALGVGFYIGINDDDVGALVKSSLVYRLLDEILGLDPIDWEERLVTKSFRKAATFTSIPKEPRTAPPTKSLIGKYSDKGYGSLEVMSLNDPTSSHFFTSHSSNATDRTAFVEAVSRAMTSRAGLSSPLMFAQTTNFWGSVYVFTHFDGPIFNITSMTVVQNPRGEWTAFGKGGGQNAAVFVDGKGMGMFENFWGGKIGKRATEERVEEQAEVWFRKEE